MVSSDEIQQLDETRPFGLSGHMVAKNEALTIRECIESLLPVLDELIVTYQTSQDKTEEILLELQKQFPKKLRVFHYKPYLPPYGRLADREESSRYPEGSIHNPSNYYNFGLVKHRYAYYMKVDGDQIYFTEKLKKIKDELYQNHQRAGWKKSQLTKILCKTLFLSNHYLRRVTPLYLFPLNSKFHRTLFALAYNHDAGYSLAGLNVRLQKGKLSITIEPLDYNGGVGDTAIVQVNSQRTYHWDSKNLYEYFRLPKKLTPIGFCWLHFKYIKIAMDGQFHNRPGKAVALSECRNLSSKFLLKKASEAGSNMRIQVRTMLLNHFWDKDKQYIPDLPELTQKVRQFLKDYGHM
jgi:glycosyltransferase involved in cell wall biosynthesis